MNFTPSTAMRGTKGYINDKGVSTSVIIRKLGTLADLLVDHGPTREYVVAWAKEETRLETLKYKEEQKRKAIQITFHANRQLDYDKQKFFRGGYLFSRAYNHIGERAHIVTQSIKKLPAEDKAWTLDKKGFKRVSDDKPVNLDKIPEDDQGLYYKDEPYTTKKLHQRLIITYSPKYARYQKTIRDKQVVERAENMVAAGKTKKQRKNPHDPARFIAVTKDGEAADVHRFLDENKIEAEA